MPADNRAWIIGEIIRTIDASIFDKNCNNDDSGAKAKHVRVMPGIILPGFVHNITG